MVASRPRLDGEKIKMGGLALKQLKKLNGLKLTLPSLSIVLAKAIGLGATASKSKPCILETEISLGLMVSIIGSWKLEVGNWKLACQLAHKRAWKADSNLMSNDGQYKNVNDFYKKMLST